MNDELIRDKILCGIKGKVRLKELLHRHTTFKIGGPARFFIEPEDSADLKLLLASVKKYKIPILVIGRGSNILVNDKGVKGIVLQLNSKFFRKISIKHSSLEAGSGVTLRQLIQAAQERSLAGVEFLAGIPGTVGGALAMNAGTADRNIGDLVQKVTVMDYNGNIKILSKKDMRFEYRKSNLRKFIILSACIKLAKKNKKEIKDTINKYLNYRRNTQDTYLPNAGCIFKNPPGESAGRLIDLCALKGKRIGGASVSLRHANFILNRGHASSRDILKLMELIKKRVKQEFNVNLEPEIKIWQ
jgi:UDP-N-acetylmuramate dehydrogenase